MNSRASTLFSLFGVTLIQNSEFTDLNKRKRRGLENKP